MRLAATLAALAASAVLTATSIAADYSYRTIAGSSDPNALSLGECPAINNFGAVAFSASEFDPETGSEDKMLRGSGGPLTTIADGSAFDSISGNPSINDFGAVAFDGNPVDRDTELIARGSGGPLTEIARARSTGQVFDSFTADVSLNNWGRVAFTGELNDAISDQGLFEGSGGPVTTRYLASTSNFSGSIAPPSLNDLERVAFGEVTDAGVRGIFRQDPGGGVTTIADETGELGGFNDWVSLNNLGRVAFAAFDDDFANEFVFTGRGGALTEVASTEGDYAAFGFRGPSLNDLGRVAFQADLDDFVSQGVFTGPNSVSDAVIRTGDTVDGNTVQFVSACREMLNIRGQVAAKVTFEDSSEAIIRATPR